MLPAIAYTIVCFVVAAILCCGYVLTRPIHVRDEMKSWRVFLGLFVFCFAGPYLYNEGMTQWHGKELDHAIKDAVGERWRPVFSNPSTVPKSCSFGDLHG